ncbi:permeases of the major facilitator superfamily [Azorhizobium caulinodans ORS 571]|uniref:Permeases of the major facilitator superfamily n=1 Tax=Azorhizobium caulinodans (strain ATCC 43989 / DSM 5975 / JCM 20966 / LMG 6465 / NBRC 14845 / NCIMB 13405 / ORS 571) TaxID=438753 RepID=A8ID39_AZOC5|nr:MFS transporter [Azorhizobium caulinodans]BAF88877.1 permeases of the major facilitator superfamily [Azorhizobium caulinodans ORS 571]
MTSISQTSARHAPAHLSRAQWRIILLASLGGSLEFYDFIIYGIFVQYISAQFFPANDPYVSLILSFSVLALGFLARPFGGALLGTLGDRYGRRPVFIASLGLTTLATIAIGLLPGYDRWGIAAPLLLVAFRLVQGVCLGGELPGAVTYAVEAAPRRAGLACGFIIFCVNVGVLIATLVNLGIQYALPPQDVASYGWRIAFLFGGVIGLVSFALRRKLEESPEFVNLHGKAAKHPLGELVRNHGRALLVAAGVAAIIAGFNGMLYGFVPAFLVKTLGYPAPEVALAMTVALVVSSIGLMIAGWAGDFTSARLILRAGSLLMLITVVPLFALMANRGASIVLVLALLSLVFSLASGIWPSILATLFPTKVRFTGIALSYNISVTILSGFAPLAATMLIERTQMPSAPALYIALCAALSLWSSFLVPERRGASRDERVEAPLKASGLPPL